MLSDALFREKPPLRRSLPFLCLGSQHGAMGLLTLLADDASYLSGLHPGIWVLWGRKFCFALLSTPESSQCPGHCRHSKNAEWVDEAQKNGGLDCVLRLRHLIGNPLPRTICQHLPLRRSILVSLQSAQRQRKEPWRERCINLTKFLHCKKKNAHKQH